MEKNIRRDIFDSFNLPRKTDDLVDKLKSCLVIDEDMQAAFPVKEFDNWFESCIKSLFWKPNHKGLILCGQQGIGKTEFFRRLLPKKEWFTEGVSEDYIYEDFITDVSDLPTSEYKKIVSTDCFYIRKPYTEKVEAVKRLTNIVATSNSINNTPAESRRSIVLFLESIDQHLYNSIDKHRLWIEIFNNFLEKNELVNIRYYCYEEFNRLYLNMTAGERF